MYMKIKQGLIFWTHFSQIKHRSISGWCEGSSTFFSHSSCLCTFNKKSWMWVSSEGLSEIWGSIDKLLRNGPSLYYLLNPFHVFEAGSSEKQEETGTTGWQSPIKFPSICSLRLRVGVPALWVTLWHIIDCFFLHCTQGKSEEIGSTDFCISVIGGTSGKLLIFSLNEMMGLPSATWSGLSENAHKVLSTAFGS